MSEDIKIAILEQRVADLKEYVLKIDDAIEKISEVNVNLTRMLAVHNEKLESRQVAENTINDKIDGITKKMEKDHENVLHEMQKMGNTLEKVETNLEERLTKIEAEQTKINLKLAIVIFAGMFLGFIIQNSGFFSRLLHQGHLTTPPPYAKIERSAK